MRISDWSSDVCSSDLHVGSVAGMGAATIGPCNSGCDWTFCPIAELASSCDCYASAARTVITLVLFAKVPAWRIALLSHENTTQAAAHERSEEHTYELQSLKRNSYDVFCLKKKT